jgi:hypothetical protein
MAFQKLYAQQSRGGRQRFQPIDMLGGNHPIHVFLLALQCEVLLDCRAAGDLTSAKIH